MLRNRTSPASAVSPRALAPLLVCLVFGVWLVCSLGNVSAGPDGAGFGNAFATYVSGGTLLHQGGDAYDPATVCRTEKAMLTAQGVHFDQPTWNCRLGNPPLYLWAMGPLHRLPYRAAGLVWIISMVILSFCAFVLLLRHLGWKNWLLPAGIGLLMPPVVYASYYGEVNGLLFAAIALALILAQRHPAIAGGVAALGWIKPPLVFPFLLLLILFAIPDRKRFLIGFGLATLASFGLTVATTGVTSLLRWGHSLVAFSHDTGSRGHVVSLLGLYVRIVPATPRLVAEVTAVAAACVMTWFALRRPVQGVARLESSAWLWTVWFLVTPYGQYYDLMMLALPVLVYLRPSGEQRPLGKRIAVPYAVAISVFLAAGPVLPVEPLTLLPLGFCVFQRMDLRRWLPERLEMSAPAIASTASPLPSTPPA